MSGVDGIREAIATALSNLGQELSAPWLLLQLLIIALAGIVATLIATYVRRRVDLSAHTRNWPPLLLTWTRLLIANLGTVIFVLLAAVARVTMVGLTWPSRPYLLVVAASLASAWVVIALVAGLIRNRFVYHIVAAVAWTLAALNILGLREPVRAALDSFAVVIGGLRVSPLLLIKTTVLLLLTLWAANAASDFFEKRVRRATDLTPSLQVLISKLIRLLLITVAIIIVLSTVGIDFSALAFFSGAIGVGLGFGLQKIVSNLVSGIILLADKSIKPGDVISVGDQTGWVTNMGARFTSIDTRDGREILVPNEDFVTQHVVNWSYSNYRMMLVAKFGVGYNSNPHHVNDVAVAAAAAVPRVLQDPAPACYFEEFGDSSLNFTLRYWIADPGNGFINVRADVMMALWDAFKREGIEIPFPQRDINLRTPVQLQPSAPAKTVKNKS